MHQTCEFCQKTFQSVSGYRRHMSVSHRINEGWRQGEPTRSSVNQDDPRSPDPVLLVQRYEDDERLARQLQEDSLMPDPVEQVHESELNEGIARSLQDHFDAEVLTTLACGHLTSMAIHRNLVGTMNNGDYSDDTSDDTADDTTDDTSIDSSDAGEIPANGWLSNVSDEPPLGLESPEIDRLPTRTHSTPNIVSMPSIGSEGAPRACQVCMESFVNGDVLRILPCFHDYHRDCIDPWLRNTATCPMCRVIVDITE